MRLPYLPRASSPLRPVRFAGLSGYLQSCCFPLALLFGWPLTPCWPPVFFRLPVPRRSPARPLGRCSCGIICLFPRCPFLCVGLSLSWGFPSFACACGRPFGSVHVPRPLRCVPPSRLLAFFVFRSWFFVGVCLALFDLCFLLPVFGSVFLYFAVLVTLLLEWVCPLRVSNVRQFAGRSRWYFLNGSIGAYPRSYFCLGCFYVPV